MTAKYLLRESHQGRIVPVLTLACTRAAKRAADALGLPTRLITSVKRRSA